MQILFKCKYKCEYKRLFIQIYLHIMLLKTLFLLPHLFCNVEFDLIQEMSQHRKVVRNFNSSKRNVD